MVKGRRDTENDISQNTLVGDCSFRLLRRSPKSGIGRVLRHPQILMAQVRLMQSNHLYFSNSPFANDLTKRMKNMIRIAVKDLRINGSTIIDLNV